ncbi:MAG: lysylphosphatidylglycerol synthase transmembrane domain-containing protein [Patescibacteria group bacterium]|nr:lysylphosphatidylglycerol synthase transmembrane domain-containing protein [Patescibacteria group bacterium]
MENKKSLFSKHKGRIIFWALIGLAFTVAVYRFSDLQELWRNIKQSNPLFISLAIFAQFFYFCLFTITYKISFQMVNIKYTFRRLFPLTFAYIFVNVVAPTFGASGPALFATEASHRKDSPIRVLAGVLIANVAQFLTFSVILLFGIFYLYTTKDLKLYQIIAASLLLALTAFLCSLFFLALKKPSALRYYLHWQIDLINKFFAFIRRKKRLSDVWVDDGVKEFVLASKNITRQKDKIKNLVIVYFFVHAVNIISLYFIFLAFNQHILFRALIAGFVMGVLFQIVGITPYGIGLTETAMALTFTSLDVPTETAVLITLTFRGITFWLPFLIGFILLRKVHIFGLKDISVVKIILENKHVENIRKAIRVRLIDIEK